MASIITQTEDFTNANWVVLSSVVVTANTHAAPSFAGPSAGLADTIDDQNAAGPANIRWELFPTITAGLDYCLSLYIQKTFSAPGFFPQFSIQYLTGTGFSSGVSINTQTGDIATANGQTAPISSGCDSIDGTWWRVWFVSNSGDCIDFRPTIHPAFTDALGDVQNSTLQGLIVVWGINLTQSSSLQTYQPDPAYTFSSPTDGLLIFRQA